MRRHTPVRHIPWRMALAAAVACGGVAGVASAQATQDQAKDASGFPADWFHGNAEQRAKHNELVGRKAPDLKLKEWMNVPDDFDLDKAMQGNVVLVDYWATW